MQVMRSPQRWNRSPCQFSLSPGSASGQTVWHGHPPPGPLPSRPGWESPYNNMDSIGRWLSRYWGFIVKATRSMRSWLLGLGVSPEATGGSNGGGRSLTKPIRVTSDLGEKNSEAKGAVSAPLPHAHQRAQGGSRMPCHHFQ